VIGQQGNFIWAIIPRYKRKVRPAPSSGKFIPRRQLLEPVAEKDIVAELIGADEKHELISAQWTGVVLTIAPPSQMQAGQKMYTIGIPV